MKRNFAILLLLICAILSLIACTVVPSDSSSLVDSSSSLSSSDITGDSSSSSPDDSSSSSSEDSSVEEDKTYAIRLYHSYDEYTVVEYEEGQTVDVSEWPVPEGIVYEGDRLTFEGWLDEWLENLVTEDFVMPSHSMAFYASYAMPQVFGWSYDAENDSYTSQKAGIRPSKTAPTGHFGNLSVTLDIKDSTTTGIGIIWNLALGEEDYPYDTNCEYWYMHLNPTTGGFQLAKVKGGYNVAKTVSKTDSPLSWQEKWANWRTFGGTLTTIFSVEFTPEYITLYIDGEELYTYDGDWIGTVVGDKVGIRTNKAGNVARNIEFIPSEAGETYVITYVNEATGETIDQRLLPAGESLSLPNLTEEGYLFKGWYEDANFNNEVTSGYQVTSDLTLYANVEEVESMNGYNILSDGSYQAAVANATMVVPGIGSRYGKWSSDITVTDRANTRLGLLINSFVPTSSTAVLYGNSEINGYYVHHNVKANVNFTLTTIYNGVYQGRPNGANANIKVNSYNGSTSGALGAYHAKNAAFIAGETQTLTFNLAVEVLNTYIKIYVDGECIYTYEGTESLGLFDSIENCIGVGFTTNTAGTIFSNYSFVPMEAVEEVPTETQRNGYTISADGTSYTSNSLRAAITVDGMGERYGKWSVDVSITERNNSRVGLYINAFVPRSDGLVRYDNSQVCCYYLHHSASANVNFTLTSIYNGVYKSRPDGTADNIAVIKYNESTEGALGEYYAKNAAFHNDTSIESLDFNLAIEVTPTYIKMYVDGECIYTCEDEALLGMFDSIENCVGVGFNTYTTGTTFTNMVFTPYNQ